MNTILLCAVIAAIVVVFAVLQSADNMNNSDLSFIPKMPKFGSSRRVATPTSKSKLQAIEPIPAETQSQEKSPAAVESNPMKAAQANSSFVDLIKDPAFRWTLLYILLAVLIYCLWPRGEYVSMGNSLILNKRTGDVHRVADRLVK